MKAPRRVLIIALRQIGDTLVTTPLIEDVAHRWPGVKIDFLGFESSRGILEGNPYIQNFIGSPTRPNIMETGGLIKRLFRQYDLALITQPTDRSYLFGLFASSNRFGVIGPNQKKQNWKRWLTKHTVAIDYFNQHVVIEKRSLLPGWEHRPTSLTPPHSMPLPEKILNWLGQDEFVVIHATPLGAYKRISEKTWQQIIQALAIRYRVVLTGSDAQADVMLNDTLHLSLNPEIRQNVITSSGEMKFSQLTTLLKTARLYIGVDTSVSHLAAAVGCPMVVFFGPTPPTNFGPWPRGFSEAQPFELKKIIQRVGSLTLIQGPGECVPCRKGGCDDSTVGVSECLLNLSFSTAWPEIEYRLIH